VLVGWDLHDGAADGQNSCDQVQVTDPQFGQFAPAQSALDISLY
jgi:hypothetical protein